MQKIVKMVEAEQAKQQAVTSRLQQQQQVVQRLAAQEAELAAEGDVAQQRAAAEQVQAAADVLVELSYAVAGLIRSTAGAVAPTAAAAAANWAGAAGVSDTSAVAAHCQQLGLHMQLAEAVAKADGSQALDLTSHRQVQAAVQQLQVGGVTVESQLRRPCLACALQEGAQGFCRPGSCMPKQARSQPSHQL